MPNEPASLKGTRLNAAEKLVSKMGKIGRDLNAAEKLVPKIVRDFNPA
jgi:hypothetical protein